MSRFMTALPLLVCAALAAFAFGWSFTFKDVPPMLIRGFQPGAFPRLVSGLVLILCALGIWQIWRLGLRATPPRLPKEYYASVIALIVIGGLVLVGDFLFALMVGCAGVAFAWGERRLLVLACLGIVAPIAVVLFFDTAFQVRFPRGFLINLYYG